MGLYKLDYKFINHNDKKTVCICVILHIKEHMTWTERKADTDFEDYIKMATECAKWETRLWKAVDKFVLDNHSGELGFKAADFAPYVVEKRYMEERCKMVRCDTDEKGNNDFLEFDSMNMCKCIYELGNVDIKDQKSGKKDGWKKKFYYPKETAHYAFEIRGFKEPLDHLPKPIDVNPYRLKSTIVNITTKESAKPAVREETPAEALEKPKTKPEPEQKGGYQRSALKYKKAFLGLQEENATLKNTNKNMRDAMEDLARRLNISS